MTRTFNWPEIGPKLLAALEDADWALSSGKPDGAAKIIDKVFREIGHDDPDEDVPDELGPAAVK